MSAFLQGSKDPMADIRASSLSNLAELCKHLKFALQPFIREILDCIYSIIYSEKEVEVRRGAVFVIELLFRGLSTEIFEIIPNDLKKLYQLLKNLQSSETDEITQYHATLALQDLNQINAFYISPEQQDVPDILKIVS